MWADRSELLAGTPLTGDVITARVIAAGIVAAGLAVVLLGVAQAARWLLDRRRLAAWEAAETSTGPQWTRRRE